jgi:hypothetical protein
MAERTLTQQQAIADDPLYQPLRTIGVDEAGIRRLFKQCSRRLIEQWIRVTDAAMHERPRGFPGFKTSPAAFLMDAIQNEGTPPDWIYEHEKNQKRQQWEQERASMAASEEVLRGQYDVARSAALQSYLATAEGHIYFQKFHTAFLEFYRTVEPDRYRDAAQQAAVGKVEREHFQFPDFGIWLLEQRPMSV